MAGVCGMSVAPLLPLVPYFPYSPFFKKKEELQDLPFGQKRALIQAVAYGRLFLADLPAPATPDIVRPRRTS
jgi:hypothetical protein